MRTSICTAQLEETWKAKQTGDLSKFNEQPRNKQIRFDQPSASDETSPELQGTASTIIVSSKSTHLGKNGHVWQTIPIQSASGKTQARDIVYIRPGSATNLAKYTIEPIQAFNLFLTEGNFK